VVGLLGVGVAAAAWPGDQTQVAYPAAAIGQPTVLSSVAAADHEPVLRQAPKSRPRPTVKPVPSRTKPKPKPRPTAKPLPKPALKVIGSRYATATLNVRTAPSRDSHVVGVVKAGTKLSVTASVHDGFRFISYSGRGRWISNKYLSSHKPKASSTTSHRGGGISAAPCPGDSAMESGLTADAIRVHRALCARYPQISAFGGRRSSDGFHGTGQAVDAMISNSSVGWDIARWTRANAAKLGVSEILYSRRIWTVQRSSEGWRTFADRGSATANHYDHVHVSVYGNRGTT
jgi:Bacterial SH3 domain